MKELTQDQWPGLPKWPGVFVTGKSVTPDQAKDIIFRTDTSIHRPSEYMGGNDHRFRAHCARVFGWQPYLDLQKLYFDAFHDKEAGGVERRQKIFDKLEANGFPNIWSVGEAWAEEMGIVCTEYVYNSWLSSSYIGGPTGWVSPKGEVSVEGHNYGKWPSVEDIVEEWKRLQAAFPYIDLVCTLHSGEACEDDARPVCTIVVRDGAVKVCEPDLSLHDREAPEKTSILDDLTFIQNLTSGNYNHEHGWPPAWVGEFGEKSTAAMKKVAPFLFE